MRFRARYNQAVPEENPLNLLPLSLSRIVDDVLGLRLGEGYQDLIPARYLFLGLGLRSDELVVFGSPQKHHYRIAGDEPWRMPAGTYQDNQLMLHLGGVKPNEGAGVFITDANHRFGELLVGRPDRPTTTARKLGRTAATLRNQFDIAVAAASEGRLAEEISPHLARVQRLAGGVVEISDLAALAAWALEEKLRHGPVRTATCPSCGLVFLPERKARYCDRPIPGFALTCSLRAKHKSFVERNPDYHREQKKLYERVRRGTLARSEYDAWKSSNTPGSWKPYQPTERNEKGGKSRGKR